MSYLNEINLIIDLLEKMPQSICDEMEKREEKRQSIEREIRLKEYELALCSMEDLMKQRKEIQEAMSPGSYTVLGKKDD